MLKTNGDVGKLLLRITVAGLMLFHGIAKLRYGIDVIADMTEAAGLPRLTAYGAYVGELVAPLLVLAGFHTRIAALVMAFNMVTAIYVAHASDLFKLNDHGGWAIELAAFYLLTSVCIFLLGPGRISVDAWHSAKKK